MYLQNYCTTACLSVLFLVGCLIHLNENDVFSLDTVKKFRRLIYVLITEVIVDCLFMLFEGQGVEHAVLYLLKLFELFLNPIVAFLVFDVFYYRKRRWRNEKQNRILETTNNLLIVIIVLSGILFLLDIFGWSVFSIDEGRFYHRGPLMPAYLILMVGSFLISVHGIFVVSRNNTQNSMKMTLFFYAGTLTVGLLLRTLLPKTNYDFLCISVSVSFLLIYYSHVTLRLDPLTQLLNRQVYMRMLERVNYTTIVIMIDANNFKMINDTHGHECGDRTLRKIARLICRAFGEYAYCFRVGGDEFCVVLKPGRFEEMIEKVPYYDAYVLAGNLMKKLDEAIAQADSADNDKIHLEYGVSQGCGVYYQPDTHLTISEKERKSFKEVVEIADRNMYKKKTEFREQFSATPE